MQQIMKNKRFLALVMSLIMLISAMPMNTFAETDSIEKSAATEAVQPDVDEMDNIEVLSTPLATDAVIDGEASSDTVIEMVSHDTEQQENASEPEDEDAPTPAADAGNPLKQAIDANGHAYVLTAGLVKAYSNMQMTDHVYTINQGGTVLLVTQYIERDNASIVRVWFISAEDETFFAYIPANALTDTILKGDEVNMMADKLPSALISTSNGELYAFKVSGEKANAVIEIPTAATTQDETVQEPAAPMDESTPSSEPSEEPTQEPITEDAEPNDPTEEPLPADEEPDEPVETPAHSDEALEAPTDDPIEWLPVSDAPIETETPVVDAQTVQVGDYVAVTKQTRAFMSVDDTASDGYIGDLSLGVFVKAATVQVDAIEQDSLGRDWHKVKYMYGDDYADGTLKWTALGSIYVLAVETLGTAEQALSVTDYAFTTVPVRRAGMLLAATPMDGFTLKSINAPIGTFTAGQKNIHGSSGKDSDYKQIATAAGHGTVYATPHYLDGFAVYCLEHTMPGPGEGSGSNKQPTGPYMIVDMEAYTSGTSMKYKASTMHAIGWVLRHTYPFMALNRNDSDNETWSRVAGQFAIREVIKQMEGAQYVRDYWDMDNFYVASGQAPSVYLTYARWLAENGIAHGKITGKITTSNKSVVYENGTYKGTVTLSTDADLIRISTASGTITGNTAGKDSSYYYLKSGDTITVSFSTNGHTIVAESVSSDEEEANFLIGVPTVEIQDVLIPVEGYPYKLQDASVTFEILYGDVTVTKRRDRGDQRTLAGAQMQLYDSNGAVVGNPVTTDANGNATWTHLQYGTYFVAETSAPTGYQMDTSWLRVEINAGAVTSTFSNAPIFGSIRVIKKAGGKDIPLVGAKYELVTKAGSSYVRAKSVVDGSDLPVLTTDANGVVTWSGVVEYGEYYVHEIEAPQGYQLDNNYYLTNLSVQGVIEVTNAKDAPITGQIRIVKKDQLTKASLAGVEFTVTRLSAPASHNGVGVGDVVAVITTDANGVATTGWLEWGKYRVVESKVPAHYTDSHFSTEIEAYEHGKTYTIDVENEPTKGYIQIVKTDRLDRTPIEGVQFDIYYADEYGSGLAGTMTTNKDGVAISSALRKGKYVVKEHADPMGYVTELVELSATVKSDETTYLSASNQPIQGRIQIIKKDELTKDALAGAEFTITRVSGLPSHKGSNNGEVVAVITTDAYGVAISPLLTWGVYCITETKVPEHYVDNSFSVEVTIQDENLKTYEIGVTNEPTKGWLQLTKTDRQNGNPIEGVQFDIYYNDRYGEGLAGTMTTNKDGIAISEPLRKGKYIVREHGETAGYLFEEIIMDATVKSDETTELQATNCHVTVRLKLYKRDVDEYTGDNPNSAANAKPNKTLPKTANISAPAVRGDGILTGAEFQVLAGEDIKDRQGNVVYAKGAVVVQSIKTAGEDASVSTDELWPGVYEIVELNPPTGYQPSTSSIFVDARSAATQSTEAIITYEGLKTNEISYGVYALIKFMGDNEIHDDAGILETPEKGAEFQIYLKSAGSYENARKFERDYLTTNEYGYVMTKPLPYGLYILEQVKGKDGYAIKSPFTIFIKGTEDPAKPPILIINNEAIRFRLKFIKVDAETGNTITVANTAFKLKDADGNYVTQTVHYPKQATIDTFYTDESGEVTLPETVTYGMYFIEEFASPDGYLILTEELGVFVGNDTMNEPGEAYLLEIGIPNEPVKGRIVLDKKGLQLTGFETLTDVFGNEYQQPIFEEKYLAGAVFDIYASEDIIGKDGTCWYREHEYVDTIVTTANGSDASKELPLGKYFLLETSAPEGYVFADTWYEADLVFADNHTAVVENKVAVGNDYLPSEATLRKVKEVTQTVRTNDGTVKQIITNAPGRGFVFGLYNNVDIRFDGGTLMADSLVATGVTDENGKLTFSGYYPHGDYYIKEISCPKGWKLNPEHFAVSLIPDTMNEDDPIIRVSLQKPIHNELIYTPITLTKKEITGEETLPDTRIEVKNEAGDVIFRAYTDENGQLPNIPLTPGIYTFREIYAPDGYSLSEAIMAFSVDEIGNVTGDTVVRDDFTRFSILKQDENGQPLAGVIFSLRKDDYSKLFTAVSDENGLVTFEKIPYGKYIIEETKPLPGYLKNDSRIEITVDGTFINLSEPLETVTNCPNEVIVKKIDQDGMLLADATFALINADGQQTMTAVSDEAGMVRFTKVPYGLYTIQEIEAPAGYLLNTKPVELSLFETHTFTAEPIATVVNQLKRIQFIKVDTAGKFLPGVEFSLIDAATDEVVEVVTSNVKGEFLFTQFDYGDWIVSETAVPNGFNAMEDITFHVDANWTEPSPITCVNIPNHYEFVKTDKKGNPLAGVKFTLEDAEGNIIRNLVSSTDGIVNATDLTPGTYIIREIETLEGYTRTDETIKVVIDEHYIVPTEMYRLVNYPNIQTGVDFEMTPVMWVGALLLLAGASLTTAYSVKESRKRNKKKHRGK